MIHAGKIMERDLFFYIGIGCSVGNYLCRKGEMLDNHMKIVMYAYA